MRAPRKSTIPPKPALEHLSTYTCLQGHAHCADRAREVTDSFDSGSAALDALLAMDVDSDSDISKRQNILADLPQLRSLNSQLSRLKWALNGR